MSIQALIDQQRRAKGYYSKKPELPKFDPEFEPPQDITVFILWAVAVVAAAAVFIWLGN